MSSFVQTKELLNASGFTHGSVCGQEPFSPSIFPKDRNESNELIGLQFSAELLTTGRDWIDSGKVVAFVNFYTSWYQFDFIRMDFLLRGGDGQISSLLQSERSGIL
jgi:hypothetical protein